MRSASKRVVAGGCRLEMGKAAHAAIVTCRFHPPRLVPDGKWLAAKALWRPSPLYHYFEPF
jgi:hypothetical protein